MKLSTLINSDQSLQKISSACFEDVRINFRLGKMLKEISATLETFHEARNKVLKEFGKDEGNGAYMVPADKREVVNSKINGLLEMEVTIDSVVHLDIDSIPSTAGLTAVDFLNLEWLITDEIKEGAE